MADYTLQDNLTACDKIQTLNLRCYFNLSAQHPIKPDEQIDLLSNNAQSERATSEAIFSVLKDGGSTLDGHTLQYLAIAFHSKVSRQGLSSRNIDVIRKAPRYPKTILTLQPRQVHRLEETAKEEIIARYAKDNYYFLEAYVDTMSEESRTTVRRIRRS